MNRITDLQGIKEELQKVEAAVEKALASGRMCDIERDITMERLRDIYDAVQYISLEPPVDKSLDVMSAYLPEEEEEIDTPTENPVENKEEQQPEEPEAIRIAIEEEVSKETVTTMEELIGDPVTIQPTVRKEIIDSLYGDAPVWKEPEIKTQPAIEEEPVQPTTNGNGWEKPSDTKPSLNDTLGGNQAKDVASVLSSQAVSELRQAIGLNDRFLLMTDLFNQDLDLYNATMDKLDQMKNIDDAYIYLYEHFAMDDSKEGVKRLIELLEAKFS